MLKLCKASFKFIKKKEQNNSKPTRKVSRVTCSKCSMVCIGLSNIDVLFSSNLFFVQMQGFISSGGLGKCRGKEVSHHLLNGYLY